MPYTLALQTYCKPEFYALPPETWERRLREDCSPVRGNLSALRFRRFDPHPSWKDSPFNLHPQRPIWALYSCTPRERIHPDRAEQFRLHWSELPSEKQAGRRAMVSDYQHYMWHVHGVEARPFWLLQGEWGGTPTLYTPREKRYLDAVGAESEPFPVGTFGACPFDERAVRQILKRDRLVQSCNHYDALEKMDRPEAMKAEDEAAELAFRETYLDTMSELIAPSVEFMKSQKGRRESAEYLPPAPAGLNQTLATWKDVFLETGRLPGVAAAPHRKVFATS